MISDFAVPIDRRSTAKHRINLGRMGYGAVNFLVVFLSDTNEGDRSPAERKANPAGLFGAIARVLGGLALRFLGFLHGFPLFLGILLYQFLLMLGGLSGLMPFSPILRFSSLSGSRYATMQHSGKASKRIKAAIRFMTSPKGKAAE